MIILQLITNGQCFDGINEKAFRIHIVTRGVSLPKGIDPSFIFCFEVYWLEILISAGSGHRYKVGLQVSR